MSDTNDINKMDYKQLRKEVQLLRDELAIMQRKYEDILYNLDDDNFSGRFLKEKDNMKTSIEITAEGIKTKVSNADFESAKTQLANQITSEVTNRTNADNELSTRITQTANTIESEVTNRTNADNELSSRITQNSNSITSEVQARTNAETQLSSRITQTSNQITAIVQGEYTDGILKGYLTGIVIEPDKIKMINNNVYSVYNNEGLRFYDRNNEIEGWAIEPSQSYGGVLNYYINDVNCYRFGTGENGTGYVYTDMVIKAMNNQRGRLVFDVSKSGNKEIKFVGLNNLNGYENIPCIYANEKLLATQSWVLENAGGGTAKFA